MKTRYASLLLVLVLTLAGPGAPLLRGAETTEPGALWRIERLAFSPAAAMGEDEGRSWLGKTLRITQTNMTFEGRSCRVAPEIEKVETGVFLASMLTSPADVGIEAVSMDLVRTGCDIPGLETLLGLPDGRFVLLHQGVFMFMRKAGEQPPEPRDVDIPDAGVVLRLPKSVRLVTPHAASGPGLRFWYKASPVADLEGQGQYPFTRVDALRDRAALAIGDFGVSPPQSLPSASNLVKIGETPVKTYVMLDTGQPCGVVFRQMAIFFHKGWVVQLALSAAPEQVMAENPGYFQTQDCGQTRGQAWRQGMDAAFHQALEHGGVHGLAGQWRNTFAGMLASMELRAPRQDTGFLGSDHGPCRAMTTDLLARRFPDHYLVREQTFALHLPTQSGETLTACLATLSDGLSNRLTVTTQGGILDTPLPQPDPGSHVRAIAIQDINLDGLPDFLVMLENPLAVGKARFPNTFYGSRYTQSGPKWLGTPDYARAIQGLETVTQARKAVTDLRQRLQRQTGREMELVGALVREEPADGDRWVLLPEVAEVPVRYVILYLPPDRGQPGERLDRIWARTRILQAEDAPPPLTYYLEVLELKVLPTTP